MGFLSHIVLGHCNPLCAAAKIKSKEESPKVSVNPFNKSCKKEKKDPLSQREVVGSVWVHLVGVM